MSIFLRLTDAIINKNVIHHIHIKKDKYIIHFMTNKTNSFFLLGGAGLHHIILNVKYVKQNIQLIIKLLLIGLIII
jgi:hypothetical protein